MARQRGKFSQHPEEESAAAARQRRRHAAVSICLMHKEKSVNDCTLQQKKGQILREDLHANTHESVPDSPPRTRLARP
jgi:hypothetical protein